MFLRSSPILCFIFALAACGSVPPTALLVYGGDIVTGSTLDSTVEAMLVRDGRVLAVGDYSELSQHSDQLEALDLKGATVLPGIVDSHAHVRELGTDAVKANLVGVRNTQQMVRRLQEKFPDPEPGTWLVGQGWDEGAFASTGYPDRMALDNAYPNNPIYLESLHGFASFVNGRALEIAGIDRDTPDPEVGQILKRVSGDPSGVLLTLAQGLVSRHVPPFTQAQVESAIVAGLTTMAKAGVTSVHEAGMKPLDVAAYLNLAEAGQLPIRVYGLLDGNNEPLMQEWFARGKYERDDAMLAIRGIKVFYDGSLGSRTAMLRAAYSDKPDEARPTERITPAAVRSLADRAVDRGFQMAVHAIGDEGNDRTLGIYERSLEVAPDVDHRWRIEHAQVVLPDFFDRAARLKVISSVQSSHAVGDSVWAELRLGPERIRYAYAWQRLLGAGAPLILNSDLPGEPWTPMETLYFAVNRMNRQGFPAGGWYPDQALSVSEALHAMTLAGAHSAFQDQQIGSLEPGKMADFVVLSANPLKIDQAKLADIAVLSTWVAGKPVKPE